MNREKIWRFVRKPDNLIPIITVIISIILAYLGIQGKKDELTLAGIVTVLAGIAAAQLISNYQTLEQQECFERIEKRIEGLAIPPGIVLKDRTALPPLENYVEQAKEVFIAGRTLLTIATYRDLWTSKVAKGCKIRFIVVNPDILKIKNLQNISGVSLEVFNSELRSSLERFRNLMEVCSRYDGNKIEIRLINYVPEMVFLMINGKQPSGRIRVELQPYNCDIISRPHFELTAADKDPRWYHLFCSACEQMWEDATPWGG